VPVDWVSVAASGAAGAFAGAVVSWIAAPHLVGRQERGRSMSDVRNNIRELVTPELTKARKYQGHALASHGRDREGIHTGDITFCGQVLTASLGLARWRRITVKRRLTKLFGPNTVALCEVHGATADDPQAALPILLNRQLTASRHPDIPQPDTGEFDKALRQQPDSKEVDKLIRSLSQLAESR
jgi:hypothetical protein